MVLVRIMVGPVNHPTLVIPFILTEEINRISRAEIINSWCQVDIMGNQYRLAGREIEYETLVPGTLFIIFQYRFHRTTTFHLQIADTILIRVSNLLRTLDLLNRCLIKEPVKTFIEDKQAEEQQENNYNFLSHYQLVRERSEF